MGRDSTVMSVKNLSIAALILALGALSTGCGKSEQAEYKKEDFQKTAPPPGYINNVPKAPGGPPSPPPGAEPGK